MCMNPLSHLASERTDAPVVIYSAKKVVTMERDNPEATAVAVSAKQIVVAGSLGEVKEFLGDKPYRVDDTFVSKVILPGFIDQHLHPLLGALTLSVEVIAPEDWVVPGRTWTKTLNPEQYIGRLKEANALANPNEWLFTWGYQQYFHGAIDRRMLDSISSTRAIVVWHRSCHEFYLNTAALDALGITLATTQGKGKWSEQSDWVRGHFYEGGLNLIMAQLLPKLATPERFAFGLKQMVEMLHHNGVTAFNEPGALITPQIFKLYQEILGIGQYTVLQLFHC